MEPVREGELHPLQNQDILEIIFKGSTLDELKSYRLVCRTWMEESSKAMKDITKVRIHGAMEDEDGRGGISAFLADVDTDLTTFAEDKTSPTDTVHLVGIEVQDPRFWTVFGHRIKSLKMMSVDFKNAEEFRHAIFQSCPNLVELEMVNCSVGGVRDGERSVVGVRDEPDEYIPPQFPVNRNFKALRLLGFRNENFRFMSTEIIFLPGSKEFSVSWMEIFVQFPSLEELEVRCLRKTEDQHLLRSLEIVRQHENRHHNWKLIDLTIDFAPPAVTQPLENPQILADANLPLMNLSIRGIKTSEDRVALRETLDLYAGSIKKLTLSAMTEGPNGTDIQDIPRVTGPAVFPLPNHATLPALQELDLCYGCFDSMDFMKYFPALKKLTILGISSMLRNTSEMYPAKGCMELKLRGYLGNLEDIRKLHFLLPNIKNLKMFASANDSFAAVCELWPNLGSLDFFGSFVDDCGITGMNAEDVERINREGSSGVWKPIMERKANITYLTKLKKLAIHSGPIHLPFDLGYCSAAYGIQCLPQLEQFFVDQPMDGELWNLWKPILEQFPWKG